MAVAVVVTEGCVVKLVESSSCAKPVKNFESLGNGKFNVFDLLSAVTFNVAFVIVKVYADDVAASKLLSAATLATTW